MAINLSFPDSTYSSSNKPSAVTLKSDLAIIETAVNAMPVKATGAEVTAGTDDAKFLTPKAVTDSTVHIGTAQTVAVATSETTASTSYTALATAGPVVTITISAKGMALVSVYTSLTTNVDTANAFMGFAISGATTVASSDAFALQARTNGSGGTERCSATFLVTGLNAGSNVFTSQYKVNTGTGTFLDRKIIVIPL